MNILDLTTKLEVLDLVFNTSAKKHHNGGTGSGGGTQNN